MAEFSITPLMGGQQFIVEGIDDNGVQGQEIIDSPAWGEYLEYRDITARNEVFDASVKNFFKPLVEAAEQASQSSDDRMTLVVKEPVDGEDGIAFRLDHGGVVLRTITDGDLARLRWIAGVLVVLA